MDSEWEAFVSPGRSRGKFNFAKYFQEKNPEPLVFAPFSKGIQEMDGGGTWTNFAPELTNCNLHSEHPTL